MKAHLRIVDTDTGEVHEQHPEIQRLEDEIRGLQRSLASESRRYEELKRDKDAEARSHQLWPTAVAIFEAWKVATGHKRSKWKSDRFWIVEPWLKDKAYGVPICLQAVAGIAFDPWKTEQKNGGVERHDGWDTCFKTSDRVERYANKAPKGWRELPHFAEVLERWKP